MKTLISKLIYTFFISGFFIVLISSFMRYGYVKEFMVQIEVPCDPALESCFVRDCGPDSTECPISGIDKYRTFQLSGNAYADCYEADGCESYCKDGSNCSEIVCDVENGDICSTE